MTKLPKYPKSRARPIVARFQHKKDLNDAWSKRRQLTTDAQYIRPMYPPTKYRKRRVLQMVHSITESVPRCKGKSKLLYSHKFQVDTDRYQVEDIHMIPDDLQRTARTAKKGT